MPTENRNMIIDILAVLEKYSDQENALTQRKISYHLEKDFKYQNLKVKRRSTVRRNIIKIIKHFEDEGNKLNGRQKVTMGVKENSESSQRTYSQFMYHHDFSQAELRLLIDSIFFSPHITKDQRKKLIDKLKKLTSENFNSHLDRVLLLDKIKPFNQEIFKTIKILDEAIRQEKKVSFYYETYGFKNGKPILQKRLNDKGEARRYIINPYELVINNGRYYLVCNFDYFDDLSNYRVDRIIDIKILDENRKKLEEITKSRGLDLEKYIREHIYMFGGKSMNVRMKFKPRILSEFIDWFGTEDVVFREDSEGDISASVVVNKEAVKKWALQYANYVTIYHPESLVKEMQEELKQIMENYGL